jgi:hypothetical protein
LEQRGALFGPRSDTVLRVLAVALAAGALLLVVGPLVVVRSPLFTGQGATVDQPIQFDHRHHVGDDGIDCSYCHREAQTSSVAGFPSAATCLGCHAQIWMQSPILDAVKRSYFSGEPIRWRRVYALPEYVYFDHSIHLAKGVGCKSCHGRVDQMASLARAPELSMGFCLGCHRDPDPHLVPRDQVTRMEPTPPDESAAGRGPMLRRYGVLPRTDCTTCHR